MSSISISSVHSQLYVVPDCWNCQIQTLEECGIYQLLILTPHQHPKGALNTHISPKRREEDEGQGEI
jgi:hypothetical protein